MFWQMKRHWVGLLNWLRFWIAGYADGLAVRAAYLQVRRFLKDFRHFREHRLSMSVRIKHDLTSDIADTTASHALDIAQPGQGGKPNVLDRERDTGQDRFFKRFLVFCNCP